MTALRKSPGSGEGRLTCGPAPGNCYEAISLVRLLSVEGCVFLDEVLLVFGHIFKRVNRVGRAGWDASTAIDAALRIDVHLGRGFESGLVRLGMDAIGWANLNTEGIFDAVISNHISHDESVS